MEINLAPPTRFIWRRIHSLEANGNPIAITRHVMEMGIQAASTGGLNVAMAKQLAGMMIAAISLATLESAGQSEKL